MSERFVTYFWEMITFTTEKFQSDADTCEYIYFYDLKDSPEARNVIFPFLLSRENPNVRRVRDVLKIYFGDYGDIRDIEKILNNCAFCLYAFKASGEKVLMLRAPLFIIPVNPIYKGLTFQEDPRYRMPYRDIEMEQIYDYFNIVLTFDDKIKDLSYPVNMGICIEAIGLGTIPEG